MDLANLSDLTTQANVSEPDENPLPLPEDSEAWDAIFEEVVEGLTS